MKPIFFSDQIKFRKWLAKNSQTKNEVFVGYYKVATGKESMTWSQSVDEALCFGWIDGIRKSINEESYCIRFTPRKANSNWSKININKIKVLTEKGLMKPAGIDAFNKRKVSNTYSFENNAKKLPAKLEKKFQTNKKAWNYFLDQAPYYKKTVIHWITAAKREETQFNRLKKVITSSENQKRLFD